MAVASGIAGAGASIFSGINSQNSADDASKMQWKMYQQMRSDLSPFMQAGQQGLGGMLDLLGFGSGGNAGILSKLQSMPGYQFALTQGQQGVDRSMAARGLGQSGGEMKDIDQFSQGLAEQNYNNLFGQMRDLAGMGQNSAASLGPAGMNAATNAGEAGMWGATQFNQGLMGGMNNLSYGLGASGLNWGSVFGNGGNGGMPWMQWSDRRLKTDAKRLGRTDSGLPLYTYRLKGSALPQIGVMADEVEQVDPGAVSTHPSGFKQVNYDRVARLPATRSYLPMKEAA